MHPSYQQALLIYNLLKNKTPTSPYMKAILQQPASQVGLTLDLHPNKTCSFQEPIPTVCDILAGVSIIVKHPFWAFEGPSNPAAVPPLVLN